MKCEIESMSYVVIDALKSIDRFNYFWENPTSRDIPDVDEYDAFNVATITNLILNELSQVLTTADPVKNNEFSSKKFEEILRLLKHSIAIAEKLKNISSS